MKNIKLSEYIKPKTIFTTILTVSILLNLYLIIQLVNNKSEEQSSTKIDREAPDILFSDYENLDKTICGLKTETEIINLNNEWAINNFKKFPELAGYYVPKDLIDSIEKQDIDMDGKLETI